MDKLRTKTVRHTLYKSSTATTKSEEEEGEGGRERERERERERRGEDEKPHTRLTGLSMNFSLTLSLHF